MIKEILFADTHNYHGKVDHRFIDLATQFSRLQDARSHQGGATLVVYFQGQKVVDIFTGKKSQEQDWQSDTLAMCYSTGKGVLSTLAHILVSEGLLDYDQPIAHYWPEFSQNGKANITLRHVLSHQSGLFDIRNVIDTATEMYCPFEETSMYKILADEYHFNVTGTGGWNQVPEEDFSMMTLYHPQSAENICKELVEDKWKGKLEFLTSGKYWVDIVMPEVGKGTALEEICRQLGIAPEETIAFGDNLNDISMIQSAGKGYAVNTAREETKKAADEVIPGYAENGVLEVLKTFM